MKPEDLNTQKPEENKKEAKLYDIEETAAGFVVTLPGLVNERTGAIIGTSQERFATRAEAEQTVARAQARPETLTPKDYVTEEDVMAMVGSSESIELLPEARKGLESYLRNKQLKPEELEAEMIKFEGFAQTLRLFDLPIAETEMEEIINKGDLAQGMVEHLEKNASNLTYEQLNILLQRLPGEMENVRPLLERCYQHANENGNYAEEEYLGHLMSSINDLSERMQKNPKSLAQLVELEDDFKILAYRSEEITAELSRGPYKNLSSDLEANLLPITIQFNNALEALKDKIAQARTGYNKAFTDSNGNILNPKDFYEINQ